jgi:hypothetical protein
MPKLYQQRQEAKAFPQAPDASQSRAIKPAPHAGRTVSSTAKQQGKGAQKRRTSQTGQNPKVEKFKTRDKTEGVRRRSAEKNQG